MRLLMNSQLLWLLFFCLGLGVLWLVVRFWVGRDSKQTARLRRRLTDGSLSPRGQHYYFAHVALRTAAFDEPEQLLATLGGPDPEKFLAEMWDAVGKDIAASGEEGDEAALVAPDGLEAIPGHIHGRPAVIVILPPPRAATEAYFVAIVLNHELGDPAKPAPEPALYYFTLEKGFTMDASTSRTAFCEWDGSSHKNYGDGPAPDARLFLNFINAHLAKAPAAAPHATSNPNPGDLPGN